MRGFRAEPEANLNSFSSYLLKVQITCRGKVNCKDLPARPGQAALITIRETTGDSTPAAQDRWESRNLVFSVQGGGESGVQAISTA